ncbi:MULTISPECIES: phage major capsid protein, P2 family [Shewanella]|jgi:P2 family phage major capsid protein|uniref:Phage major capsid protein, P2 family n=1 Tax=Shewanella baltica (strain OS155 / ATCC BAA-1091) TaxID=325240 RepID=A3D239_SHEB5|nr:phage major capsid protein, P2 family [Shewanella baltica]ABN60802.1 phage major capsid protein, P2 family [Shewanella baltica OS155]AEH13152.1 phage major capsid protein, P2 family [Shewanella baltica OS117]MCS6258855.1 phage major capsid protein, P2 family [Shewanella baltica]
MSQMQILNAEAAKLLPQYSAGVAKAYGVTDASKQFSVSAPMETKLRAALLESVDFLGMITALQVDQMQGQVVNVGDYGIATGRKVNGRFNTDQGVGGNKFELKETDSCASLKWNLLSTWANSGNPNEFLKLMKENATKRFALDMIRIGFNGKTIAAGDTDPVANPNGEDVNKGWHQLVKENAPDQIMGEEIYFNPDADVNALKSHEYKTLDAIVTDLRLTLIHPSMRNDPRLVVLVGSDLVAAAQIKMMNLADKPSEKVAAQQMDKSIGGLRAYTPPFFPGKRIVVTPLSNMHLYTQKNTSSRKSENSEDRKQHEDKYWRNEGYAIEEYEAYAAVDEDLMTIGAQPA